MRAIIIGLIMLLISMGMVLSGCTQVEAPGEGTIEVFITTTTVATDTPTEIEIASIKTKVSEIKIYRQKVDEDGEWVSLYVAGKPLDLLLDSNQNQFLAFVDAEDSSSYNQISLVLESLDITLSDGSDVVITLEPFEFTRDFVIFGGQTTDVVFTFKIDKSVVIEEGTINIKPISEIIWKVNYQQPE